MIRSDYLLKGETTNYLDNNCSFKLNIKIAFLQVRQFERTIFRQGPTEADISGGYIWKLNKCLYKLNASSQEWDLTGKS